MKRLVELRGARQSTPAGAGRPTPMVTRSLALATMIVLGEADEAHAASLVPLLNEPKSSDCLKMAKLNLFQCLSVAGPQYEDVFCVGEHGLAEAGQCLAAAAGLSAPAPAAVAAPVLLASAEPPPAAGVSVPIALLAEGGPERSAAFAAPPAATPAPVAAGPILLAQAAPAAPAYSDAPAWGRESMARAQQAEAPPRAEPSLRAEAAPSVDAAPPAYARAERGLADRGLAYRWDRQTRATGYAPQAPAAPAYGEAYEDRYEGADDRYVDPRQAYGRYQQQPRRLQPQLDRYGRPYADEQEEEAGSANDYPRQPAPGYLPNYWGFR